MSSEAVINSVVVPRNSGVPRTARRDRFFLAMSAFMLASMLIGFSRTLFLRPLFHVPVVPWYVYVHGAVMVAWIVLLMAQTSLIAAHRTDLHRRLGVLGGVLAVALVTLGVTLTLHAEAIFKATGGASSTVVGETITQQFATQLLWGNLGLMAMFAGFVATALWMRRRSDVHKRLLLLASMVMIAPAIGRVTEFPTLAGAAASSPVVGLINILVSVLILGLPLTLVAHDLITTRRVHRATAWGVGLFVVISLGARALAATAAGPALWNALQ